MPVVYVEEDSYVHNKFAWGFTQFSSESDGDVAQYALPDSQWKKFRDHFEISSFSRIHFYEPEDLISNHLDEYAKRTAGNDETLRDDSHDILRFVGSVKERNLLYLLIGLSPAEPSEDSEGNPETEIVGTVVIRSYTDVIGIRVENNDRAEEIYRLISRAFGRRARRPESDRPSFDEGFRKQLNERLAEKYTQVWFRNEQATEPANVIHFQGREDLRNSNLASDYFDRKQPYAGFVRIIGVPETEFHFNWREHRISFEGSTLETERLEASNQIIGLLDLQRGYPVVRTFYQGEPLRAEVHESFYTVVWVADMGLDGFINFVRQRDISLESPVLAHSVEGNEVQMNLGDIDPQDIEDISFVRVYAAAEEEHQTDYTWERHADSTLIGVASESDTPTVLSRIYESTTDYQLDRQVMTVLNRFGSNLNLEESYD